LRASLVMCCAGVDAALKQAIRDWFEHLLEVNKQVREGFEKFIRKRIGGEGDLLEFASGAKFLAQVLAEKSPRARLIEEYIRELRVSRYSQQTKFTEPRLRSALIIRL